MRLAALIKTDEDTGKAMRVQPSALKSAELITLLGPLLKYVLCGCLDSAFEKPLFRYSSALSLSWLTNTSPALSGRLRYGVLSWPFVDTQVYRHAQLPLGQVIYAARVRGPHQEDSYVPGRDGGNISGSRVEHQPAYGLAPG